ncbi:UDP-2,3-diacylglucosamine diphosphatase [Candidatus Binatus sp.]|uniref:UDP-2,3-diacylglucosamine diphosphatase n=1 Tax=Candidatus Binatus sp. TaxID=2811406 RepID=UPI003BAEB918
MFQRSYYRTIWISDVHLGTRACKASSLLDFLRHHISETLYLVGDIVDGWNCGPSWHWSFAQQELVDEIVRWRRIGVNVVFMPGNHDEGNPGLVEELFGRIPSVSSLIHTTLDGSRMLVIHGHQFDGSLNLNRLLPKIGSNAYARAQRIHDWYNRKSEQGSDEGRSLSDYLREPARKAIEFLTDFRDRAVLAAARDHKADGVICGHIHRSDHRLIGNVMYVNDGDWVHNRTALVEDRDGTLQILRWSPPPHHISVSAPMPQEAIS